MASKGPKTMVHSPSSPDSSYVRGAKAPPVNCLHSAIAPASCLPLLTTMAGPLHPSTCRPAAATKKTRVRFIFLLCVLLKSCAIRPVSAFAEWINCRTDLEEGEVIMNNRIVPHTESREKSIRLVAYKDGELVSSFPEGGDVLFQKGDEFVIRLFTPSEFGEDGRQVQFVMDATEGGLFAKPNSLCEGRRAIGRQQRSQATLTVGGDQLGEHADVGVVSVWAGWATEREAVTLTPELTFRRADGGGKVPAPEDTAQPPDL